MYRRLGGWENAHYEQKDTHCACDGNYSIGSHLRCCKRFFEKYVSDLVFSSREKDFLNSL